jgi:peptidyl-tRNA hydrolase, PTH2 family
LKQVIVIRTDLGMRKGKMVAQGAHASVNAILPYFSFETPFNRESAPRFMAVKEWLVADHTKVCLQTPCLEDLEALELAAREAGLITCLITDAGKTEFKGVPTITCCAIGPGPEEEIDKITGELKLL